MIRRRLYDWALGEDPGFRGDRRPWTYIFRRRRERIDIALTDPDGAIGYHIWIEIDEGVLTIRAYDPTKEEPTTMKVERFQTTKENRA